MNEAEASGRRDGQDARAIRLTDEEKQSRSPKGGCPQQNHKAKANDSPGKIAFAPTLEHRDESNQEKNDGSSR